jgi:small subunit ribosomal protein S16
MLKLRLARFGCKNRPFYRLVAISSKRARDAKPIEYVRRRRALACAREERGRGGAAFERTVTKLFYF